MTHRFEFPAEKFGVDVPRDVDSFTARIEYHPAGEPGHAYLAQVLGSVVADSLEHLGAEIARAIEVFAARDTAPLVRDPESWQAVAAEGRRFA